MNSPDGHNTCTGNWNTASLNESLTATVNGTPQGNAAGTCIPDGPPATATTARWNYSFNCPDPVATTCPGGGYGIFSADSNNYCAFSWGVTNIGNSITVPGSGTPPGSGAGTCGVGGLWNMSYNCPNPA